MKSAGELPKKVISWKLDPFQAFQFGCPEPLLRSLLVFIWSSSGHGCWGFFEEFSFKEHFCCLDLYHCQKVPHSARVLLLLSLAWLFYTSQDFSWKVERKALILQAHYGDTSAAWLHPAHLPVSSHWALQRAFLQFWQSDILPVRLKLIKLFVVVLERTSGVGLIFLSWTLGLRLLPKGANQGNWAMLEITQVPFAVLLLVRDKYCNTKPVTEFFSCAAALCWAGMNLSMSLVSIQHSLNKGLSNSWCQNCLQLCRKFKAIFFKHTSPLHCRAKRKNSVCIHQSWNWEVVVDLLYSNSALGGSALEQKLPLVFGNSSCTEGKNLLFRYSSVK